eukprot:2789824-Amphidinium_carterae.2
MPCLGDHRFKPGRCGVIVDMGFEKSRAALAKEKQKKEAAARRILNKQAVDTDVIPVERTFTLGSVRVDALRDRMLPALCPFSLSSANLRAHERKLGGRSGFMQLFEFVTGLTEDFVIGGVFGTFGDFTQYAQLMAAQRGDRGSRLRLPPVWASDGVYEVKNVNGITKTVTILEKYTGQTAHLNFAERMWPSFSTLADVEIILNFSEVKAKLHSKRDPTHLYDRALTGYFTCRTTSAKVKPDADGDGEGTPCKKPKLVHPVIPEAAAPVPFERAYSARSLAGSSPDDCKHADPVSPFAKAADGSEEAEASSMASGVEQEAVEEEIVKREDEVFDESTLQPPLAPST